MTSIQAPITAWMAYSDATEMPPPTLYIAPFRPPVSSYPATEEPREADPRLAEVLRSFSSPFITAYFLSKKAFGADDRYTLFVPLQAPVVEGLVDVYENASLGFSYRDRKFKAESEQRLEELLQNHMVSVKIEPHQVEYRNTRVEAVNHSVIHINEQGEINDGVSQIQKYISLPNCTVFLISKEISLS